MLPVGLIKRTKSPYMMETPKKNWEGQYPVYGCNPACRLPWKAVKYLLMKTTSAQPYAYAYVTADAVCVYLITTCTLQLNPEVLPSTKFWTNRGDRSLLSLPSPAHDFASIAHRVQHSHCFISCLHLSASNTNTANSRSRASRYKGCCQYCC